MVSTRKSTKREAPQASDQTETTDSERKVQAHCFRLAKNGALKPDRKTSIDKRRKAQDNSEARKAKPRLKTTSLASACLFREGSKGATLVALLERETGIAELERALPEEPYGPERDALEQELEDARKIQRFFEDAISDRTTLYCGSSLSAVWHGAQDRCRSHTAQSTQGEAFTAHYLAGPVSRWMLWPPLPVSNALLCLPAKTNDAAIQKVSDLRVGKL